MRWPSITTPPSLARVRKLKDKPNAEGSVNIVSTWILAALRKQQCFSVAELNRAIREKLSLLNAKPFQKRKGAGRVS